MCSFKYKIVGMCVWFSALWLITSCSEPEVIIPPLEIPTTGQNVLVEELTGVRCPNCPSATARLESIKSIYGKNIILVNIHGNLLTRPLPESRFDFRNEDASSLEEQLKPFIGKPSVIINRKIHPQFDLAANPLQDQWQPIIEDELQLVQRASIIADIFIEKEKVIINAAVGILEGNSGPLYFHAFLTENNIIDAQEDVDRIIEDYRHDHVLRYIFTPETGREVLINSQISMVENISEEVELADISPDVNQQNLEVVLFLTDAEGEVVQAYSQTFE